MGTSRYSLYVEKWNRGCGASICPPVASRVVLCKGQLPCDVLFIGEAPGESENVIGKPFVGPAGQLLDLIVQRSIGTGLRVAYTNLVGCIPRDEDNGGKLSQPSADDIECCAPRLQELIDIAKPTLVVCVGKLAEDWLRPGYKNPVVIPQGVHIIGITHPAAILRSNVAMRGLGVQKCVANLNEGIDRAFGMDDPTVTEKG